VKGHVNALNVVLSSLQGHFDLVLLHMQTLSVSQKLAWVIKWSGSGFFSFNTAF